MNEIEGIKLQHSVGRLQPFYRDDMNMSTMSVARVTRVHHKRGTADIELVNSRDKYSSSVENEGRFSARILQRSASYDEKSGRYWGTIDPVSEGSLVLVAFLDGMKTRPIILGTFFEPDNHKTPLTPIYPLSEKQTGFTRREALKKLTVYPNMTYKRVDGEGNMEMTFGNKSFLIAYNLGFDVQDYVADRHGGFDHIDLSENDKRTGETLETDWEESKTRHKVLYVHRDFDGVGRTKVFIDDEGMLRITRDNEDETLSYVSVGADGSITFRRQLDSPYHEEGENVAEVVINATGDISLTRNNNNDKTILKVTDGVEVDTTGDFTLRCRNFKIEETGGE